MSLLTEKEKKAKADKAGQNGISNEPAPDEQEKAITGGDALILSLIEEGVDTIFGYPGGAIMPVYDSLYHYADKLKHILVRHEQGAAHAADGYAQITGKPGVCLATSGPGATNLVTGIADAMLDSVSMVCITGQVAEKMLGTDAFQETDVMSLAMPITKWCYQVTDPDEIPDVMAKAFYIAKTGRPGPVLIDITKSAQMASCTKPFAYNQEQFIRGYKPAMEPEEKDLEAAVKLINQAKKPFLFVGHGVLIAKAQEELKTFVEKTGIPVASTLLGLSAFPTNHPLYVGYLGMHGNYGPNMLTNEADLIIAVGMRFDDRVTGNLNGYAKQAKVLHIDIDQAEIGKNVVPTVGMLADAKEALKALIPKVNPNKHEEWRKEFDKYYQEEYEKVIKKDFEASGNYIKMGEVIHKLAQKTEGKAIWVADVGQHQMTAARYGDFPETNSWITSGGLGTMGYALPASLGVKTGAPHREVIAIIGDGCFQMTIQELGTIAQSKLPVKILLLNNNFLGMVRQWQELFFDTRYSFVELQNPDFITIAKGFGINGHKIMQNSDLDASLDQFLASEESYLLEVVVEKEGNVFPMVPAGANCSDIRLE